MTLVLPAPRLETRTFDDISVLTDDALASSVGIRALFTRRFGGKSTGPYASLNLASHVDDDLDIVLNNRAHLMDALGYRKAPVIVPNQVHGVDVVTIADASAESVAEAQERATAGADALIVETEDVAALLCFADCTPIIVVSPTGRFSVIHAGWRGALAGIAGIAVRQLIERDVAAGCAGTAQGMNVYIGPHIRVECFETSEDVCEQFARAYGDDCVSDDHVSMARAVTCDLIRAGLDPARIIEAPYCTQCNSDEFFSYRASGGVCGRHGAFAIRDTSLVRKDERDA